MVDITFWYKINKNQLKLTLILCKTVVSLFNYYQLGLSLQRIVQYTDGMMPSMYLVSNEHSLHTFS